MKKLVLAIAVFAVGIAGASAADMAVKVPTAAFAPVYSWTGFYLGGNAGYAWGHTSTNSNFNCPTGGFSCPYFAFDLADLALFSNSATGSRTVNGFTGGAQAGYNWQSGATVFGIETDFNALNLRANVSATAVAPGGAGQSATSSASVGTNWLYTLRARVGWTVTPTALLYATGGLAVSDLTVRNSFADNASVFFGGGVPNFVGASSTSSAKAGYAVGAGAEWALNGNWTVKAEYLYVDFGSVGTTLLTNTAVVIGRPSPNAMATSAGLTANIVRAGLNYKFN